MEKSRKPKIRFKGFTDDWEQRKLGDFGKATGGISIESEFSEDGIYKVISIGSYSENSVYNDQGIRAFKSDKTSNRVLNKNDLTMILNDKTTSGNIIGRVLLIEKSGIYVYNQRTERIEINKNEFDPLFLYEMLNAPNVREKIIKQAQGNTQIYVNWSAITMLDYMIPSKKEQVEIGQFLHSIGNLITLHQRKLDKLVNVKKSMLEKMFPQQGSRIPEIRFCGFTDDWEQRKLSDIYQNIGNAFVGTATPYYVEQGHFYLESNNIKNGQINHNSEVFINNDFYERQKDKWLHTGDMVMVQSGHVGHAAVIPEKLDNSAAHALIMFRNAKVEIEPYLLNYQYQTSNSKKKIDNITTGNTIKHILASDMKQFTVDIPSIGEQQLVANYFIQLDELITLHQRKLEKLKNIKKSMLEKMFI